MRACWSVNAVPCGATMFCTPAMKQAIKSSWPSQIMANPASRIGALGLVQAVENFAFGKDRSFGRIDIFGSLFVARQHTSAETHDAALFIANRKHEPSTKTVIVIAGFLFPDD